MMKLIGPDRAGVRLARDKRWSWEVRRAIPASHRCSTRFTTSRQWAWRGSRRPAGRCRRVSPAGARSGKNIAGAALADCMAALPGRLFYSTPVPACLWDLAHGREWREGVLFIDTRERGRMMDGTYRELTEEGIARIVDTHDSWWGARRGTATPMLPASARVQVR